MKITGARPVDSLCVPTQGPPGGAGFSSQPAPDGVWEGESPVPVLCFSPLLCDSGVDLDSLVFKDPAGGPHHHRQPGDQRTDGGVASRRGEGCLTLTDVGHARTGSRKLIS